MKSLEEKKKLVAMMRAFGQPIDEDLVESIKREEKLNEAFFGKENKVEESPLFEVVKEAMVASIPPTPPAVEIPSKEELVTQVINVLDTKKANTNINAFRDKEIEGMRRTIAEMMQKISTLSWGGGGTGIVQIGQADDFDQFSYAEGRYLRWVDGMFRLDEVNPHDVTYNTTVISSNNYTLDANDYYLGVTYTGGNTTITLPSSDNSGRVIVIKDETGNCSNNPIIVTGTVDNDPGGFILQIDNGAIQLLFRNGWRII